MNPYSATSVRISDSELADWVLISESSLASGPEVPESQAAPNVPSTSYLSRVAHFVPSWNNLSMPQIGSYFRPAPPTTDSKATRVFDPSAPVLPPQSSGKSAENVKSVLSTATPAVASIPAPPLRESGVVSASSPVHQQHHVAYYQPVPVPTNSNPNVNNSAHAKPQGPVTVSAASPPATAAKVGSPVKQAVNNNATASSSSLDSIFDNSASNSSSRVAVLSPQINLAKVRLIFQEWKRSLWFAPTGFESAAELVSVRVALLPFYLFDCTASAHYQGAVCVTRFDEKLRDVVGDWRPIQTQTVTKHSQIYGPIAIQNSAARDRLMQLPDSVRSFDFSVVQSSNSAVEQLSSLEVRSKLTNGPNAMPNLVVSTVASIDEREAWSKLILPQMHLREEEKALERLKIAAGPEHSNHMVRCQCTRVQCSEISFRVIYAPLYFVTYRFDQRDYVMFVNSQSGKSHHGDRPYGMGAILGKGITVFGEVIGVTDDTLAIVDGELLCRADRSTIYPPTARYLLFPPSDNYLIRSAIGSIRVQNTGSRSLRLSSIRRHSDGAILKSCELAAGAEECFDYSGAWCIEVSPAADSGALKIEHQTSNGGGQNSNRLGMC